MNLSVFSVVDTGHCQIKNLKNLYPFDFVDRSKKKLVVTVGDSWTWGTDMTPDNNNEYRLKHHFGHQLACNLNADWLSLGQSGSGNFWMYDRVREFARIIPNLIYDQIYVVCTLTETGRAVSVRTDIDFNRYFQNYHVNGFIKYLNNLCVNNIVAALRPFDNVLLKVGTNFVDYLGDDHEFVMSTPWLKLICQQHSIEYTGNCQTMSPWAISDLRQLNNQVPDNKHNDYLNLLETLADSALERKQLLLSVPGMNRFHPTSQGHRLWADYVLKFM